MLESIKKMILDYVEIPEEEITGECEIIKDLHMNSFDVITLLGDLEATYDVHFEQEDINQLVTINDVIACIKAKLK